MSDPTPNSENYATCSLLPPTQLKATPVLDADSLLRGDMTQAEKIVVKLDNDCNQDTGSGETYLEVPRFEPVISATEHAVIEATEQQESTTLVELLIQLLCKNRDPAQPRLNDIQEDDEVSKIMAHSDINKLACNQTFGKGLGRVDHTKIPGDLLPVYMMINRMMQAVELVPDDHPDKPGCLSSLGIAYYMWFNQLGKPEHIRRAVECLWQSVALTPDNHPDKPGRLKNLGCAYEALFDRLGELQHIHLAVDCQTQAVVLTPDGHPDKPGRLSNLGSAYQTLFDRLGELPHIYTAVDCQVQAVALTPDGHPDKPTRLNNLGSTYWALFNRLGELQHIHMAANCQARAIVLAPDNHPHKPTYLNNLATTYQTLFDRLGELQHIHLAVDCQTQAVVLIPL